MLIDGDGDGSGVNGSSEGFSVLGVELGRDEGQSLTEGCKDGRLLGAVLVDGDADGSGVEPG